MGFITALLNPQHTFLASFIPFMEKIIRYGAAYSLAQTVIKITAPGIPDIYQGCELWDLSYVDPDNRRPVDYAFRKELLYKIHSFEENRASLIDFIRQDRLTGIEKLFVTWQLLHLRNELQPVFLYGSYTRINLVPDHSHKAIAYVRSYENQHVLIIIPVGSEPDGENYSQRSWNDVSVQLPDGLPKKWINVFTEKTHTISATFTIAEACADFPVAVFKNI